MTRIIGVDPGLSGAVAIYDTETGAAETHPMPVHQLARGGKNKREIDLHGLAALIVGNRIGHAFVEQVGAMPGQGTASMFAFGKAYGVVLGVLAAAGVPMTLVPPQRWKKALGVPAAKDGARARASQLLPDAAHQWVKSKDDGRAEAALIALYGARAAEARPFDAVADAVGSYYDAIAEIGRRVKAGAPVPTTGYFEHRRDEP